MTRFSIVAFAGAIASVFVLHIAVAEAAKESVVYSFCSQKGCRDGKEPEASVIDVKGTLYGTTLNGGGKGCKRLGCGVVFSIDPTTGKETVLHAFGGGTDGQEPFADLIDVKGTLYGTTRYGGAYGGGIVFSIDPATGAETALYSFCSQHQCADGQRPEGGLIDVKGTLYGTTTSGGTGCRGGVCGTVFSIDPATGVEKVVHSFGPDPDGQYPGGDLIDVKGTLYGTTSSGGTDGLGTVFSINLATGAETMVYSFCSQRNCTDGDGPLAGLINVKDTLFGTTVDGGTHISGTAFSIDLATGAETVVYSFCGRRACRDGELPSSSLTHLNGTVDLLGTTQAGGSQGGGTVFAINRVTGKERRVYSFGAGAYPSANLINVKGTLYGTTTGGGANGGGTVFKLKL